MGLDQYAKVVKRDYNNETLTETIQTLKFLSKAKKALNEGNEVEYSAWY